MSKLSRADLMSLEEYSEQRNNFRAKVIEHKKNRRLALGEHAAVYFEDSLTMQYQIQEMLRIEKIFEADGIQEELDVYNPLIPDGHNWKATFMIEYQDVAERKVALAKMVGIEDRLWMRVDGHDAVHPICNEDLERSTDEKTSSVHFIRFELTPAMITDLKNGAKLSAGIDHEAYEISLEVPANIRESLVNDLALPH